jgi:UDP-N-acetyl-D-galactosamine dehydrogenase
VPDIVKEFLEFGIEPLVYDPLADGASVHEEYGLHLSPLEALRDLEALVLAVPHQQFLSLHGEKLLELVRPRGVVVDVKSMLSPAHVPTSLSYWSL